MNNFSELEKKLGIKFNNINTLITAMTHSSYANENQCEHNERLEFLGDAVLELCMSDYLYHNSKLAEGDMTKTRASFVCEDALVIYANQIKLNQYLRLGHGEEASGGRTRQALIADAFEALLGAVYFDLGFNKSQEVFNNIVIKYIDLVDVLDSKSKLQEYVQANRRTISYEIVKESGPSHNKTFEAVVKLEDEIILGYGTGKTKKEAEQNAASAALTKIAL